MHDAKWKKLVNIWQGGFCMDTVEFTSRTWDEPNASELRMKFLEKHIEQEKCIDCGLANEVKRIEEQIALELGPAAVRVFETGGDITKFPGASKLRDEKIKKFRSVLSPDGSAAFDKWVDIVTKRAPLEEMMSSTVPFRIPNAPGEKLKAPRFLRGRKLIVELYLAALQECRSKSESRSASDEVLKIARGTWGLLQQSRIFEIPGDLYTNLADLADRLISTRCGFEPDDDMNTKESIDLLLEVINKDSKLIWPDKFPFDTCYLALDPPVELSNIQKSAYGITANGNIGSVWLCGYVVSSSGFVISLLNVVSIEDDIASILPLLERHQHMDRWVRPASLSPWIITWLVEWINDHQVTIEERTKSFGYRDHYKKTAKKMNLQHIPAPYYTITMREEILQEKRKQILSGPRRHWELQYRHDVRGCTNCRIMRGPLPLDPKLEKQLRRDKRRKIYTDQLPDPETAKELAKRGVAPKRRDEWLAVLLFWRKDHIKGPPNAPFIPAIRRSARRRKDAA